MFNIIIFKGFPNIFINGIEDHTKYGQLNRMPGLYLCECMFGLKSFLDIDCLGQFYKY